MKTISTLWIITLSLLLGTPATVVSQGDMIASIYFNPLDTDPVKKVHLYLYYYNNANSTENLVQIRWVYYYNPTVLQLISGETEVLTYKGLDPNTGLNSNSYLTDRQEDFPDITPSFSNIPSTSISAIPVYNINPSLPANPVNKIFNVMEYQRSAGLCNDVLNIPGKQNQLLYHAVFTLNPLVNPSTYKLDTADNGFGTEQFIAEFLQQNEENVWPTPSNQFKEIVLVKYHDLSMLRPRKYTGSCPAGDYVNGATTQPMDVNDYFLKPTPGILPIMLPLTITDFDAKANHKEVMTTWNTAGEKKIQSFDIQRTTNDKPFVTIGTVAATNRNSANYQFVDRYPLGGILYYRLRIHEYNGTCYFSKVVMIKNIASTEKLYIIPNLTNKRIGIKWPDGTGSVQVRLLNAAGVMMGNWRLLMSDYIQIGQLPRGIYLLECLQEKNGQITTTRFLNE